MEIEKRLSWGPAAVDWEERVNMPRMREERLAKARAAMAEAGVDAALLTGENVRYTTALRTSAPHIALVFADGRETYVFLRHEHGENVKKHCPWINPDKVRGFPILETVGGPGAYKLSLDVLVGLIEDALKEANIGNGVIASQAPADVNTALKEKGYRMQPLGSIMDYAREVKTIDEVNCLRMVGCLADAAWCRMIDAVRPGVSDCEVAAKGREYLVGKGAWNFNISLRSGPNCYPNWGLMTDRIMQPGDLGYGYIMGDLYMGYHSCYHRTYCVGVEPTQKQKDWYKFCYEHILKIQDAIKPGNSTADVAKEMPTAQELGVPHEYDVASNWICHGVGVGAHDFPNISRFWSLECPIEIKEGQCIAIHTCYGEPGVGGVRIENVGVVTKDGWQNFFALPYDGIYMPEYQLHRSM